METNTLNEYCKIKGWQGATIHQVIDDAKNSTLSELDKVCGHLASSEILYNLSDPENAKKLMDIRLNKRGL